jgi:membrane-associated phospholipid phosphatase
MLVQPMRQVFLAFLLAGLAFANPQTASYPYRASVALDVPLGVGAGLLAIGGQLLLRGMEPTDPNFSKNDLLPWDRPFAGTYSPPFAIASDVLAVGAIAPLLLGGKDNWGVNLLMLYEVLAIQSGLNLAVRSLRLWPRPFMLGSGGGADRQDNTASGSFYSGHTSAAFSVAVLAGMVFDGAHPGSKYSSAVWGASLSVAALMGVLRVAAGKHYPSDVLVGAGMGALVGWLVPLLHKNSMQQNSAQETTRSGKVLAAPHYLGFSFSF